MTEQEIIDAIKANKFTVEYTAPDNVYEDFHIDGRRYFVVEYPGGMCNFGSCDVCVDGQENFSMEFGDSNVWEGDHLTPAISDALDNADITVFGGDYDENNYGDLAELKALELGVSCDEWYGPESDLPNEDVEACIFELQKGSYKIDGDFYPTFTITVERDGSHIFFEYEDGQWYCDLVDVEIPEELITLLNAIYEKEKDNFKPNGDDDEE